MTIRPGLWLSIACLAAVGGCTSIDGGIGTSGGATVSRRTCIFTPCTPVAVTVEGDKVKVDIDEIKMYAGSRDIVLRWRLDTPGYEFRKGSEFAAPIIFKGDRARDAPNQFSDILVFEVKEVSYATIFNRNRNRETYEYKVRVCRKQTNTCFETDPRIINDY